MRRIPTLLLATLLLGLLPGCFLSRSKVNTPIDPDRVASLTPGTSTAADVVAALGAPMDVVQLGLRSAYRYDHVVEKQAALFLIILGLRGVDTQMDRVWVFFDEAGTLTHVGTTLEASDAEFDIPVF